MERNILQLKVPFRNTPKQVHLKNQLRVCTNYPQKKSPHIYEPVLHDGQQTYTDGQQGPKQKVGWEIRRVYRKVCLAPSSWGANPRAQAPSSSAPPTTKEPEPGVWGADFCPPLRRSEANFPIYTHKFHPYFFLPLLTIHAHCWPRRRRGSPGRRSPPFFLCRRW